jgi:phosphoglycerate dehydrogenase-like enzyme
VVICCQWTPETTRLFDEKRLAQMKVGSVLVNVARGEIVDEEALAAALRRDHLRGAVLDVYVGEFERAPMPALWSDPRMLITPHISSASDQDRHGAIERATICAPISTAGHSAMSWIGNGAIEDGPRDPPRRSLEPRHHLLAEES